MRYRFQTEFKDALQEGQPVHWSSDVDDMLKYNKNLDMVAKIKCLLNLTSRLFWLF